MAKKGMMVKLRISAQELTDWNRVRGENTLSEFIRQIVGREVKSKLRKEGRMIRKQAAETDAGKPEILDAATYIVASKKRGDTWREIALELQRKGFNYSVHEIQTLYRRHAKY